MFPGRERPGTTAAARTVLLVAPLALASIAGCGQPEVKTSRPTSAPPVPAPAPLPVLSSYVVGAMPPGSKAALTKAGIGLDCVTHILPAPIFPDEKRMSGGTHGPSERDKAGNVYGCTVDMTPAPTAPERRAEIRRLRLAGFAAWSRGVTEPDGAAGNGDHYHLVWAGARTSNRDQRQQLCSFLGGYRGVASEKARRSWQRDTTIQADEIRAVRRLWIQTSGKRIVDACSPYEAMHRPYR